MQTRDLSFRARRAVLVVTTVLASALSSSFVLAAKADHAPITHKSAPGKGHSKAKVTGKPCELPKRARAAHGPAKARSAKPSKAKATPPRARHAAPQTSPAAKAAPKPKAAREKAAPKSASLPSDNDTPSRVVVLELEPAASKAN